MNHFKDKVGLKSENSFFYINKLVMGEGLCYLSVSTDTLGTGFGDLGLDSFLLPLDSVSLKRMVLPNPYFTFKAL